jgi:hypothetical protein
MRQPLRPRCPNHKAADRCELFPDALQRVQSGLQPAAVLIPELPVSNRTTVHRRSLVLPAWKIQSSELTISTALTLPSLFGHVTRDSGPLTQQLRQSIRSIFCIMGIGLQPQLKPAPSCSSPWELFAASCIRRRITREAEHWGHCILFIGLSATHGIRSGIECVSLRWGMLWRFWIGVEFLRWTRLR